MEFTAKQASLLKAIKSLQSQAARENQLVYISDVRVRSVGVDRLELSTTDRKIAIDAEIRQAGSAVLPIRRLSEVIRSGENAQFRLLEGGQMQVDCGRQTYYFSASSAYEPKPAPTKTAAAVVTPKRRTTRNSMLVSVVAHVILAIVIFLFAIDHTEIIEDSIAIDFVKPAPKVRRLKRIKPKPPEPVHQEVKPISQPVRVASAPRVARPVAAAPGSVSMEVSPLVPETIVDAPVTTTAQIDARRNEEVIAPAVGRRRGTTSGRGLGTEDGDGLGRGGDHTGGIDSLVGSVGATDAGVGGAGEDPLAKITTVPDDKLGAILVGERSDIQGHIRFTRLIHSLADWWQDPSALPSFMKWLSDNTRIRADIKLEGGAMRMTDPRILDAPIIVMTGHDKEMTTRSNLMRGEPWMVGFTPEERSAMRKYLVERGGLLFFDDCGFKGLFAACVADELNKILPEYPLQSIPHNHELYSIYYTLSVPPNGGDVYWESENNPKVTKFKFQKGISIGRRLAVVYNRKDYLCAMETAEIPSRTMLRMRRSSDVHRFMVNMFVYAMKYGGNTDRSGYKLK